MSRLENWWIQDVHDGQVAYGNIYDDERYNPTTTEYQDGHRIITSLIQEIAEDFSYVQTMNTKYLLGRPHENCAEAIEDMKLIFKAKVVSFILRKKLRDFWDLV